VLLPLLIVTLLLFTIQLHCCSVWLMGIYSVVVVTHSAATVLLLFMTHYSRLLAFAIYIYGDYDSTLLAITIRCCWFTVVIDDGQMASTLLLLLPLYCWFVNCCYDTLITCLPVIVLIIVDCWLRCYVPADSPLLITLIDCWFRCYGDTIRRGVAWFWRFCVAGLFNALTVLHLRVTHGLPFGLPSRLRSSIPRNACRVRYTTPQPLLPPQFQFTTHYAHHRSTAYTYTAHACTPRTLTTLIVVRRQLRCSTRSRALFLLRTVTLPFVTVCVVDFVGAVACCCLAVVLRGDLRYVRWRCSGDFTTTVGYGQLRFVTPFPLFGYRTIRYRSQLQLRFCVPFTDSVLRSRWLRWFCGCLHWFTLLHYAVRSLKRSFSVTLPHSRTHVVSPFYAPFDLPRLALRYVVASLYIYTFWRYDLLFPVYVLILLFVCWLPFTICCTFTFTFTLRWLRWVGWLHTLFTLLRYRTRYVTVVIRCSRCWFTFDCCYVGTHRVPTFYVYVTTVTFTVGVDFCCCSRYVYWIQRCCCWFVHTLLRYPVIYHVCWLFRCCSALLICLLIYVVALAFPRSPANPAAAPWRYIRYSVVTLRWCVTTFAILLFTRSVVVTLLLRALFYVLILTLLRLGLRWPPTGVYGWFTGCRSRCYTLITVVRVTVHTPGSVDWKPHRLITFGLRRYRSFTLRSRCYVDLVVGCHTTFTCTWLFTFVLWKRPVTTLLRLFGCHVVVVALFTLFTCAAIPLRWLRLLRYWCRFVVWFDLQGRYTICCYDCCYLYSRYGDYDCWRCPLRLLPLLLLVLFVVGRWCSVTDFVVVVVACCYLLLFPLLLLFVFTVDCCRYVRCCCCCRCRCCYWLLLLLLLLRYVTRCAVPFVVARAARCCCCSHFGFRLPATLRCLFYVGWLHRCRYVWRNYTFWRYVAVVVVALRLRYVAVQPYITRCWLITHTTLVTLHTRTRWITIWFTLRCVARYSDFAHVCWFTRYVTRSLRYRCYYVYAGLHLRWRLRYVPTLVVTLPDLRSRFVTFDYVTRSFSVFTRWITLRLGCYVTTLPVVTFTAFALLVYVYVYARCTFAFTFRWFTFTDTRLVVTFVTTFTLRYTRVYTRFVWLRSFTVVHYFGWLYSHAPRLRFTATLQFTRYTTRLPRLSPRLRLRLRFTTFWFFAFTGVTRSRFQLLIYVYGWIYVEEAFGYSGCLRLRSTRCGWPVPHHVTLHGFPVTLLLPFHILRLILRLRLFTVYRIYTLYVFTLDSLRSVTTFGLFPTFPYVAVTARCLRLPVTLGYVTVGTHRYRLALRLVAFGSVGWLHHLVVWFYPFPVTHHCDFHVYVYVTFRLQRLLAYFGWLPTR